MKKKINQMTFQQAHELAFMLMDDNGELPVKDRVIKSEIGISSKSICRRKDSIDIYFDCRCFVGKITVKNNGDVFLRNDDDELQEIRNQYRVFVWLNSRFAIEELPSTPDAGQEEKNVVSPQPDIKCLVCPTCKSTDKYSKFYDENKKCLNCGTDLGQT